MQFVNLNDFYEEDEHAQIIKLNEIVDKFNEIVWWINEQEDMK